MVVPSPEDADKTIGVVITNDFEKSSVASFYKTTPDPVKSQMAGLAGLMTPAKYAFVRYGTSDLTIIGEPDDSHTKSKKD